VRLKPNSILVRIIWLHILTVGLATVIIPLRAYEVLDSCDGVRNQNCASTPISSGDIEPQGDGTGREYSRRFARAHEAASPVCAG
jgi:hypothetical protein